ncbi:MAG: hypothetical protein H6717_37530 [Polyangiaceae bacterium]|nr:hypothetical protein [Polyangiaceae bacterium]
MIKEHGFQHFRMMSTSLRIFRYLLSALVVAAAVSACSSNDDASLGGNSADACGDFNWRKPSDGTIVCPGAPGCSCSTGQVCCVSLVGGKAATGTCGALTDCADLAMQCDGAEDCAPGQVCCLLDDLGGGTECRAPQDCFFTNEITLCRTQDECDGVKTCAPSQPGTYLAGVVGGCGF